MGTGFALLSFIGQSSHSLLGVVPLILPIHTLPRRWTLLIWDRPLPRLQRVAWSDIRPVGRFCSHFHSNYISHKVSLLAAEPEGALIQKGPQIWLGAEWENMRNETAFVRAHISSPHTSTVSSCPVLKWSCERIFKKSRHSNVSKSILSSFSSSQSWIVAPLPSWVICFLLFTTSDMAFDYAFCAWKWTHHFSSRLRWTEPLSLEKKKKKKNGPRSWAPLITLWSGWLRLTSGTRREYCRVV